MLKEQIRTEIARIFDNPEAWHVVKNTYGDITIDEPILKVEWVADQILALFPQGDKDGLLSPESFQKIYDDFFGEGSSYCNEIDDTDVGYMVAQAQHTIDQQHEAQALKEQMERVIDKINRHIDDYLGTMSRCKWSIIQELEAIRAELEGENE